MSRVARRKHIFLDRAQIFGDPKTFSRSTNGQYPFANIRFATILMPVSLINETACPPKRVNR